jgi:NAD(P)-dependent dehydrogenase (short-subunit alcohol dehydrogenase family)
MSVCIVTGAAAGNGLAISRGLRAAAHHVVGIDRISIPESAVDFALRGDVLDNTTMSEAFAHALSRAEGSVHLINNAGITCPEFPQSDHSWEKTLDINLTAPFRWSREFAKEVFAGQITDGSIIYIGSLATERGFPKNPAYHAAKSGALGLTRAFARDLGCHGIRVNCISPGYIRTAMTEGSFNDPTLNAARRRHTLLNRWGEPNDVANAVVFLCDSASSYITGINLPIDGGWLVNGLIDND